MNRRILTIIVISGIVLCMCGISSVCAEEAVKHIPLIKNPAVTNPPAVPQSAKSMSKAQQLSPQIKLSYVNQVRSQLGLRQLQASPAASAVLTPTAPYSGRSWMDGEKVGVPGALQYLGLPPHYELKTAQNSAVHAYFQTVAGKTYLANIRISHTGTLMPPPGAPKQQVVVKGTFNGTLDITAGNALFAFKAAGTFAEVIITMPSNVANGQFFGIELIPVDMTM